MRFFVAHRFIISSLVHALVANALPRRRAGLALAISAALGVALVGCGEVVSPGARSSDAAPESDGPDGPDATQVCTPGCRPDDHVRECTEYGANDMWCLLGCVTAEARCRSIVPSNNVNTDHLAGSVESFSVPDGALAVVDTDVGSITVDGEPVRDPGVGVNQGIGFGYTPENLSVFAMRSFSLGAGAKLWAHGERPLVILSARIVYIQGTINVSAGCDVGGSAGVCGGPGGGRGAGSQSLATGCGPGGNGGASDAQGAYGGGGGGGGYGQAGAVGAAAQDAAGGSGGESCQASVTPLRGGSGGGHAGFDNPDNGDGSGGGGGGAVQITSLDVIQIEEGGGIDAGGGGGGGGRGGAGGGGGGAGGVILLEATGVRVRGAVLAANGGGGGGEFPGQDGGLDGAQAKGGLSGGGFGGALAGAPTTGTLREGKFGGGGGGAIGLIHIRAPMEHCLLEDATASPVPVCVEPELW
jgi:hypothetical protein